jgi:hypothetical protein
LLCNQCKLVLEKAANGATKQFGSPGLRDPVSALLCARCGSVLPFSDPDAGMLLKLSQLSRFGLGADDRPLLVTSNRD